MRRLVQSQILLERKLGRLEQLEEESGRLRRLVSDLSLDKETLREFLLRVIGLLPLFIFHRMN
jgi:hypothetical protein